MLKIKKHFEWLCVTCDVIVKGTLRCLRCGKCEEEQ